jgi:large subunit ribosomal protein L4
MAEVEVKNLNNEVVDRLTLADEVFDYAASETLVWEAVQAYLAGQRKGTHATKNRALVSGAGKKLWRQKGTGRARVGSLRSPLWRKGGTVFGPQPRDYSQDLPKQKRRGALKMALTDKLRKQKLIVVEGLAVAAPRTKEFLGVLRTFNLDKKILVVDEPGNRNLLLSARNLPGVQLSPSSALNAYDVLNCEHLLISKQALLNVQEVLQR